MDGGTGPPDLSQNPVHLENNLRRDLHIERLAGPQTWSSVVVPDGVANHAVRTYRAGPRGQILPIEHVEHFRAELQSEPFPDGDVLEHRQVDIRESRTVQRVPAEVARWIRGSRTPGGPRRAESRRIDPRLAACRQVEIVFHSGVGIPDQIHAGSLRSGIKVEWLPAMERQ